MDSAAEDVKIPKNTLVKIDVQGFELQVLQGAVSTLKKVQFVLVESSKVELYEGQALFSDVDQFLTQHGFGLIKSDQNAVDVIQSDYLESSWNRIVTCCSNRSSGLLPTP